MYLTALGLFFLSALGSLLSVCCILWFAVLRKRGGSLTKLERIAILVGVFTIVGTICCVLPSPS